MNRSSNCPLSTRQLTGQDSQHLENVEEGVQLYPACADALLNLRKAASREGYDLQIASAHRSFERQLAIWNGKARGLRPVHDDAGVPVGMDVLNPEQKLWAILRFSALPGSSRHHWGTDVDVFDAAAVDGGYVVKLTPEEVAPGGRFDPMHCWLDEQIAAGASFGFYRPYAEDRNGVAPERWHLSYAPIARECERAVTPALLISVLSQIDLELWEFVENNIQTIYTRFIQLP